MDKKNSFARNTLRKKTEKELKKDILELVKKINEEKQNNSTESKK